MKILITGVGVTGKSSFRKVLVKELSKTVKVVGIDGDYDELPEFKDNTYIIEDVHATMDTRLMPIKEYDLIYYLIPSYYHHFRFWLSRIWRWYQNGYGSWDKHRGTWLGTGQPYDIKNIPLFCYLMLRDMYHRRGWIKKDLKILPKEIYVIHPPDFSKINKLLEKLSGS